MACWLELSQAISGFYRVINLTNAIRITLNFALNHRGSHTDTCVTVLAMKVTFSQDLVRHDDFGQTHMTPERTWQQTKLQPSRCERSSATEDDLPVLSTNPFLLFWVPRSAEHSQAAHNHQLQLHLPCEGLERHAGLGLDVRGEDLSLPGRSVH